MGFVQPGSSGRALACVASLVTLAGCGDRSDRSPRSSSTDDVGASSIDDVGASSIDDVGGGQSGNEGEGNLPFDWSDVVGEGENARSFVELGRLGPARMVRPLRHVYEEGRDGAPARIGVYFQALFSQELMLRVELPDFTGETTLAFPSEAAMYLYETIDGAPIDKVAVAGRVVVTPADDGARIDLEDIVMRVGDGTAEERLGDGVIEGEMERVCFYLPSVPDAPQEGAPQQGVMIYPDHVQDETWSTPFCAQYR
jgi:hypothetical protein